MKDCGSCQIVAIIFVKDCGSLLQKKVPARGHLHEKITSRYHRIFVDPGLLMGSKTGYSDYETLHKMWLKGKIATTAPASLIFLGNILND